MVSKKTVQQIITWHKQGFNVTEIQKQLQIPEQLIRDIINNSRSLL